MDSTLFNSYNVVFAGTLLVGVLMLAVILFCFVAVMSVVGVLYGLVHAVRRLGAAVFRGSMTVVSAAPIVLRNASRVEADRVDVERAA